MVGMPSSTFLASESFSHHAAPLLRRWIPDGTASSLRERMGRGRKGFQGWETAPPS